MAGSGSMGDALAASTIENPLGTLSHSQREESKSPLDSLSLAAAGGFMTGIPSSAEGAHRSDEIDASNDESESPNQYVLEEDGFDDI